MASRISRDRQVLRRRHYVRKATSSNYWFDFTRSQVSKYRAQFGDNFCLIINGSDTIDDAYILPFSMAKVAFAPDAVDHRGRWIGTIVNDHLTLVPSGNSLYVGGYHNAFELLAD